MLNGPDARIHCLSSCVKYVLSCTNIDINEVEMMLCANSTRLVQSGYGIDTMLNDVIWNWIHNNFLICTYNQTLPYSVGDLLYLPVKVLEYSRVYQTSFIANKHHFVVITSKKGNEIEVYDPFIPTIPISEAHARISLTSNKNLEWIEINLLNHMKEKNIQKKQIYFDRDHTNFQFLISKIEIMSRAMALDLVGDLGESSLEGSRKLLFAYQNYIGISTNDAQITTFERWQSTWLQLRTNIYRYYLTNHIHDKKMAIENCTNLLELDQSLFKEFEVR